MEESFFSRYTNLTFENKEVGTCRKLSKRHLERTRKIEPQLSQMHHPCGEKLIIYLV